MTGELHGHLGIFAAYLPIMPSLPNKMFGLYWHLADREVLVDTSVQWGVRYLVWGLLSELMFISTRYP